MSQGPLCPNLSQKVQAEVYQIANRNLSCVILLGGLSVNLNHLIIEKKDISYLRPKQLKMCTAWCLTRFCNNVHKSSQHL